MLTLEINDRTLSEQIARLLQQRFGDDPERMMAELLKLYESRLDRLQYSGRIDWPEDALTYQKELRRDW